MVKSPEKNKQVVEDHNGTTSDNDIRYKGVRKRKWGKYVSEIRLPHSRERIWLGSYDTPEKAARAFDAAQYCLRGKEANFNFPQNPPDIANATSLKPQEIQLAAAKFANEYQSTSSSLSEHEENDFKHLFTPLEYSSPPSTLDRAVAIGSDLTAVMDWPFLDFSVMTGSESSTPDFGNFGGLDDFAGNYLAPEYPDEEVNGEDYSQSSFLWNF